MNQTLSQKIYPNAVRMRPVLFKVGVLVVLTIIIGLIVVMVTSLVNKRHTTKHNEQATETVVGNADIWYQNQNSAQPKDHKVAKIVGTSPKKNAVAMPSSIMNQSPSIQSKPDGVKPLTSPITSNQLTGEQFYRGGTTIGNSVANDPPNTSTTMLGEDPGQQNQKTAFLQQARISKNDDYLSSTLQNPISPYEVQAGNIIPALLMTGINSDLPGQITAQVKTPVYDSVSGRYRLIPQGARLIGLYDSSVVCGQERVLVAWRRIIFPNGQSIDLAGMPGIDLSGYSGFHDQVNNHYGKIFGSVILMSVLSAGAQLSQPQQSADNNQPPTVNQMIAQSLGANISNTSNMLLKKNISIPPTLQIRPGYAFNVMVTKDMIFPSPYGD